MTLSTTSPTRWPHVKETRVYCFLRLKSNMDTVTNKLESKGMYLFWDLTIIIKNHALYNSNLQLKKVVFALSCCGHRSWDPNLTKQLWKSKVPNPQQ